jgi:transglutaminase-like putative cysteine protease
MRIRIGYDLAFSGSMPTPIILMLSVHPTRLEDLSEPHRIAFDPPIPSQTYTDHFGNLCTRIVMPPGTLAVSSRNVVYDSGLPDPQDSNAGQIPIENLPDDSLEFLLDSRYCDTDRLSDTAWSLFGRMPPGWARVQAICDYVHDRLTFSYPDARSTRTAWDGHQEGIGVCRDFAHLSIALCRCMNIPARYCTGYLGDIGVPPVPDPMDFSAWFEVLLEGGWYTFDARHNQPRIGRILMARGRDAADVALSTSFGSALLHEFRVITEELPKPEPNRGGMRPQQAIAGGGT